MQRTSSMTFRLLGVYVLTLTEVTSELVSTYDSVHSWPLYSPGPLGDINRYPSQSHYPDPEQTSPYPSNTECQATFGI